MLPKTRQKVANEMAKIIGEHPEFLIIVGDPKKNLMGVGYKGKMFIEQMDNSISWMPGNNLKKVLLYSKFDECNDGFIARVCQLIGYEQANRKADQFFIWLSAKVKDLTISLHEEKKQGIMK